MSERPTARDGIVASRVAALSLAVVVVLLLAAAPAAALGSDVVLQIDGGGTDIPVDGPGVSDSGGDEGATDGDDDEDEDDSDSDDGPDVDPSIAPDVGAGGGGQITGPSGGDGDDSGGGFVANRMQEISSWFMNAAAEESTAAIETLMGELNQLLYTIPAPGIPSDPMSWYFPDNGWWPDAMAIYWMFGGLAFGVATLAGGASFIVDDPGMSDGYLRMALLTMGAIFIGPLVMGAYLHFINAASLALAPSGDEFLSGPDDMAQLAAGSALVFILLKVNVAILIAGVGVLLGQFILVFALWALWPLSWASRSVPVGSINSSGALLFNAFVLLGVLKILQSGLVRIVFELDWSAYAFFGAVLILIATIIILLIALVGLPWTFGKQLLGAAGVHLGMAAVAQKSEKAKSVTVEKAGSARSAMSNSVRGAASRARDSQLASSMASRIPSRGSGSPTTSGGGGSRSANSTGSRSTSTSATSPKPSGKMPPQSQSQTRSNVSRRRRYLRRSSNRSGSDD